MATIAATMGQYAQLAIRGKVQYHADVTVTENSAAKNFTGWTALKLELKAKDDEDGSDISTVVLAVDGDPSLGLLDIDITAANTTVIQDGTVHEGVYDAIANDAAGETHLLFYGDWRLTKGVTD
jgi:hypothetical protein